jgi:hypothetical protein
MKAILLLIPILHGNFDMPTWRSVSNLQLFAAIYN